ncbi:hypothetical protein P7K49_014750, partial [Saguinus oedipus]
MGTAAGSYEEPETELPANARRGAAVNSRGRSLPGRGWDSREAEFGGDHRKGMKAVPAVGEKEFRLGKKSSESSQPPPPRQAPRKEPSFGTPRVPLVYSEQTSSQGPLSTKLQQRDQRSQPFPPDFPPCMNLTHKL